MSINLIDLWENKGARLGGNYPKVSLFLFSQGKIKAGELYII